MKITVGSIIKRANDILIWLLLAYMALEAGSACAKRTHGLVRTESVAYTESNCELDNPNRGFYSIYGFTPSDKEEDFQTLVTKTLSKDEKMLSMIQINLCNYTKGPISKQGLENIEEIFQALEGLEKQYLIRSLYDWNGKNAETEPEDVEIILNHMRQLEYIFREYEDIIFIQQGIFIGNWGEMNGTKHLDSMQKLALQLAAVTGEGTYLGVRMPAQWRKITGLDSITEEALAKSSLARRLSLYNDGMMGNEGDYGTYSTKSKTEAGAYSAWNRAEELAFQSELCSFVPNGGEVITENPLNDFESAVQNLEVMHVTYLNRDYDRKILNKWAASVVTEEGCFQGMDGLTYVERHLGYRLLITDTSMQYDFWPDELSVEVNMKNVGFAPLYKEPEKQLVIQRKGTEEIFFYPVETELRSLAGGTEAEEILKIKEIIPLTEYEAGEYEVYFSILDTDSGRCIELANEQKMQELGYKLGEFQVDELPDFSELLKKHRIREQNKQENMQEEGEEG